MYKILFIDEQKEAQDDFRDYVDLYPGEDISAEVMFPQPDIDEMIENIIQSSSDAIISDFRLNEFRKNISHNIPYNGVDLLSKFSLIKVGFPCFILTAFDNEAVPASEDVNIVYVKSILHNFEKGISTITFLDKVKEQILHYRMRVSKAEEELETLIKLRGSRNATISDESRLIELDSFLEKSLDGRKPIPSQFKELSNKSHLDNLVGKVDDLLKKLEDKN